MSYDDAVIIALNYCNARDSNAVPIPSQILNKNLLFFTPLSSFFRLLANTHALSSSFYTLPSFPSRLHANVVLRIARIRSRVCWCSHGVRTASLRIKPILIVFSRRSSNSVLESSLQRSATYEHELKDLEVHNHNPFSLHYIHHHRLVLITSTGKAPRRSQ